jgi:hypothetical protein
LLKLAVKTDHLEVVLFQIVLPQLVDFDNGHSVEDHGHPAEIEHVRDGELVRRSSDLLRITHKLQEDWDTI